MSNTNLNDFRLKSMDDLPMDEFQSILVETGATAGKTNEECLEEYFTHIEITHIYSLDVERKQLKERPLLLIMAGPNGAGKTSIMTKLAKHV